MRLLRIIFTVLTSCNASATSLHTMSQENRLETHTHIHMAVVIELIWKNTYICTYPCGIVDVVVFVALETWSELSGTLSCLAPLTGDTDPAFFALWLL